MKLTSILFYSLIFISILLISCAKIGSPSGGAKEVIPPKILESTPQNKSTNFVLKKIKITFDEFIQLVDINNKLIISPLLDDKPNILAKGKTLHIDIEDNILKSNTTYTLNFADAICDIHENTPFQNFSYVFSTGQTIDSLKLSGQILNSYTLLPEEDIFVFLYTNFDDSIPYKEKPFYLTKTDKNGDFILQNLRKGQYKIFALKDANSNYLFDQANESIAFIDSLITINGKEILPPKDTLSVKDSTASLNDSIINTTNETLKILLFEEDNLKQYVLESKREERRRCDFIFQLPTDNSFSIKPLYLQNDSSILEIGANKDTITYWLTNNKAINSDTISFELEYATKNDHNSLVLEKDTILVRYKEKKNLKKKIPTTKTPSPDSTQILTTNIKKSLGIIQKLKIICNHPNIKIDTSKIEFTEIIDSIETPIKYNIYADSSLARNYIINFDKKEKTTYNINIYPSAFTDIYEFTNDTLLINFTTKSAEEYGNLSFNIKGIETTSLLQLTNLKGTTIIEKYISSDTTITYNYLPPNKYKMRFIEDSNNNKKWDTGKYLKKIQAEKVRYFESDIVIKKNWDSDLKWEIK